MNFTKVQISELMRKHAQKENGLHDHLEIMLESMMVAERGEFLSENLGNKGNGYRPGHTYGHGRRLEFRIPQDRYGNFHPQVLAILRDQEEDCERLAMTNEEAVITLIGSVAMEHKPFDRQLPNITTDKPLFPD